MVAPRYVHPRQQWMDKNGNPGLGWKLYFYQTQTSTPLSVYADEDLITPLDNPVIAEDDGGSDVAGVWPTIFMQNAVYKIILTDADDATIWTEDPYDATFTEGTITNFYDPPVYIEGKPTTGEVYPIWNIVRALQLPAGLTLSIFTIATLPTGALVVTIKKNTSSIGTISFATDGTPTVTFLSDVNFAAGDKFSLTFPNPQDGTGADISLTFVFTVL